MMRYVGPRPKLHAWRHMGRTTAQNIRFGFGSKGWTMFSPPVPKTLAILCFVIALPQDI
jgi:hypothetical protein